MVFLINFFEFSLFSFYDFSNFSQDISNFMTNMKNLGPLELFILFLLIYIETAGIFIFFIPGDTILLISGTIAGSHHNVLEFINLIILFALASSLGDVTNYFFGAWIVKKVRSTRFFKKHAEKLDKRIDTLSKNFNNTKWGLFVVAGRFIPFIRTLVPLLAHRMGLKFKNYFYLAIFASLLWSITIISIGFFVGKVDFLHDNLFIGIVILAVIFGIIFSNKKIRSWIFSNFYEKK